MQNVSCDDIGFLVKIVANILKYLHYIIPMLLIVLIVYDMFKVFVGKADDKAKSDAFNIAVKRVIYAVIVFLIPSVLIFIFDKVDDLITRDNNLTTNPTTWVECFKEYYKGQ